MPLDTVLAFALFAFAAAITPGPSNALLMATGAAVGVARGLPCALGVASSMGVMLAAAAAALRGGGEVLGDPRFAIVVRIAGSAVLLWLAWRIASAPPDAPLQARRPAGFVGAAAMQWFNPKSWLVATGAAAAFTVAGRPPALQAAVLGTVFFVVALPCNGLWLAAGSAIGRRLNDRRRRRAFNVAMGALLAASIALLWR